MESDPNTTYSNSPQNSNNSGLLRFRSAPTSLLSNFTSGGEKVETLGSRLFGSDEGNSIMHVMGNNIDDINSGNNKGLFGNSRFGAGMNSSKLPPQYPRQSPITGGLDHHQQGHKLGSSLMRQNSSPAGLFSHLTSQNGYAGIRGIGSSYRMADGSANNGDLSPSSRRLKNHVNFSSGMSSSLGMLSQITEVENEQGLDGVKVGNSGGDNLFSSSGFPFGSWNDSLYFSENFSSGIKREVDNDQKLFVNITQNVEQGNRPYTLSHHLSLPKTTSSAAADQMAAMDKLLQLQDTVPCKIRAKRGCATHPRSIAERVRRTKISERMRKLQELVPNMDKQTNTADMLDLAIEYIKSLQEQYKILSDDRANCKCSASQKVILSQSQ